MYTEGRCHVTLEFHLEQITHTCHLMWFWHVNHSQGRFPQVESEITTCDNGVLHINEAFTGKVL